MLFWRTFSSVSHVDLQACSYDNNNKRRLRIYYVNTCYQNNEQDWQSAHNEFRMFVGLYLPPGNILESVTTS